MNLKCEYQTNPLGIDNLHPRLSWQMESSLRNQKQLAYQILVSESLNELDKNTGKIWDSKKIESDQSLNVLYNGAALKSRTQYFWKVRISDASGTMSEWSTPSSWRMGIVSEEEWQGQWIQSNMELFDYQKELMKIADHNMEAEVDMWARSEKISQMTEKVKEVPSSDRWQTGRRHRWSG